MNVKSNPYSRYRFIGGALSLAGLFIFIWMIRIQTSKEASDILKLGDSYTYVRKTFYPERGNIYDRWGHLLAGNIEVYELGVNLRYIRDPQTVAMTLSNVLGVDYTRIFPSLNQNWDKTKPGYVVISNNVSPEKMKEVQTIAQQLDDQAARVPEKQQSSMPNLDGLVWTPRLQRSYPEQELGSTILGFYSYLDRETGRGYFGVEEKYNNLLAGTPVEIVVPQDPSLITEPPSVPPGDSLVLTIDREVQAMAERVLDQAVSDNSAASGTLIISDPRTGEILAMASTPRMDPNEYWKYQEVFPAPTPFNRAIGQTYEPGSVFKVLTMAGGLNSGAVKPETPFLDTGTIVVGGVPIYNWNRGAWGPVDMVGCMQHSLNVCLSWVAVQLGPSRFYSYLQAFGIGHRTGIDLSGEVNWPLSVQGDQNWYPVNLATNSFGQGVAVTPIQMVMAAGALANDGKMMAPHVLKAVIENDKEYINPSQVVGTPITAEAARTETEMLTKSLVDESSVALVDGYSLAGKTGTAEIPGPGGYSSDLTNASFVGWGPSDNPQFLVYIWLEKPKSDIWGSVVAAPVFSEVVKNLVILLDIPPDSVRQQLSANNK